LSYVFVADIVDLYQLDTVGFKITSDLHCNSAK